MNPDRKYVAVSIKHSEHGWKFGKPLVLWGWHQTPDDAPRCFAGYTKYLDKAERYARGDFAAHGYGDEILDYASVGLIGSDFCKRWKHYDTVLVEADKFRAYCILCDLPISPPRRDNDAEA